MHVLSGMSYCLGEVSLSIQTFVEIKCVIQLFLVCV